MAALATWDPLHLVPVYAPSRAATVADHLVDAIAAGELESGQRLVESEVASRLAVSRVPLREAMKALCAQGILLAAPHRGTRVALFDDAWARSVRRARIALERLAFVDAAALVRADPRVYARLERLIVEMEQHAAREDWLPVIQADLAFHRAVVAAACDGIVATLWETLARHVLIVFGRETCGRMPVVRHGLEHRQLLKVLVEGEPVAIAREVERHIEKAPRALGEPPTRQKGNPK